MESQLFIRTGLYVSQYSIAQFAYSWLSYKFEKIKKRRRIANNKIFVISYLWGLMPYLKCKKKLWGKNYQWSFISIDFSFLHSFLIQFCILLFHHFVILMLSRKPRRFIKQLITTMTTVRLFMNISYGKHNKIKFTLCLSIKATMSAIFCWNLISVSSLLFVASSDVCFHFCTCRNQTGCLKISIKLLQDGFSSHSMHLS